MWASITHMRTNVATNEEMSGVHIVDLEKLIQWNALR